MRRWILWMPLFAVLSLVACIPGSPQPGDLQGFDTVCDRPNEGQLIAVEGFLRLPDSFNDGSRIELRLYPDMTFTARPIGVDIPFGDGPNRALPIAGSYRDSDLKLRLADGTLAPFGTRLRVSGRVRIPLVAQEYACDIQNAYLEAAK